MDDLLTFLEDGRWHDFIEISEKFKWLERNLGYIIGFLTEFEFIDLSKDQKRIKISSSLQSFFEIIKT